MNPDPFHRRAVDRLPTAPAIRRHQRLAAKHTVAKAAELDGQPTPPNIGNKFGKQVARNCIRTIDRWEATRMAARKRERAIIEATPDEPVVIAPGSTMRQARMAIREAKKAKRAALPIQSVQLSNGTHHQPRSGR